MTFKRIKSVITMDSGFFSAMQSPPLLNMSAQEVDNYFFSQYSLRFISPLVENFLDSEGELSQENLKTLSNLLLQRNYQKWQKQANALATEYDILNVYKSSYTDTLTIDTTEEDSGKNSENEQANIFGFDSAEAVGDTTRDMGSEHENTHTNKGTETRTREETHPNQIPAQELIRKELNIAMWDYISSILHDVAKDVSLSIY